jgi:Ala-tRNA(Pro) deacylase
MSAEKKLSWKLARKAIFKQLDMASEEQVKLITGCLPGAVPPFGSVFAVETFVDQSLIDQGERINFNAGLRTHSFSLLVKDFLTIE